jgi:putative ABC transport system permease protein
MFDRDRWQEVFSVLRKNKWRTFFTAFGVFWGIFMLVIMMGSGNGLQNAILHDMEDMASNSFFMWTQRTTMPYKGFSTGRRFGFSNADTKALRERIPEIGLIAPRLQVWGGQGQNNVVRGLQTGAYDIYGDYPDFQKISPMNIQEGRFINATDVQGYRKVAVVGQLVRDNLFTSGEEALGEYIRINGVYFMVVGTFKSKRSGGQAEHENKAIYIPLTTMQRTFNYGDRVGWYSITAKEGYSATEVEVKAKRLMKERHFVHPDDDQAIGGFNVEKEFRRMQGLFRGIRALIWIVGTGTLIAGIVGVSNIMLIVVRERTREIGVQRALGASPANIIGQILTEAVFLTTLAGYIGLTLGVGLLELINRALANAGGDEQFFREPGIDFSMGLTALGILVAAGLLAGFIPARKAVAVKPIEALRYEN